MLSQCCLSWLYSRSCFGFLNSPLFSLSRASSPGSCEQSSEFVFTDCGGCVVV